MSENKNDETDIDFEIFDGEAGEVRREDADGNQDDSSDPEDVEISEEDEEAAENA